MLTVLGIVIGIAAIISLVSVGEGMRKMVTEQLSQFGANRIIISPTMRFGFGLSGSGESLSDKDLQDIKRVRGVDIVVPIYYMSMPVQFKSETETVAVAGVAIKDAQTFFSDLQAFKIESGRFFRSGDSDVAIIGYSVANNAFSEDVNLRDRLVIKGASIEVLGTLKQMGNQQDDNMIVMPIDTLQEITGEQDKITMIFVKVRDGESVVDTAKSIQKLLDNAYGEKSFGVMSTQQITEQVGSIIGIISITLGGIAAISLLVAGIGIANTMLMSIMERTREIGIMKAIGATNSNVMEIFLIESATIGIIGGLVGCAVGIIMSNVISEVSNFMGFQIRTSVSAELLLLGLGFSVVVGVVSGIFPARHAAKLNPIEALRYE
jgi:putative ABC transport system permease protein